LFPRIDLFPKWKQLGAAMGSAPIWERIRLWLGGIGWRVFLWGMGMDEDAYFTMVYEQEKFHRSQMEGHDGN